MINLLKVSWHINWNVIIKQVTRGSAGVNIRDPLLYGKESAPRRGSDILIDLVHRLVSAV